MAGQDFTLTQLRYDGASGKYSVDNQGARFTWNAAKHTLPVKPWQYGIELRSVRDDYPGSAFDPIEQVLGPHFEPFTLQGLWDDKWAGEGYAEKARQQMEKLASTGAPVRLSFEALTFDGLIKNLKISYFTSFRIGYAFTISPHFRDDQYKAPPNAKKKTPVRDYANLIVQASQELQNVHDRAIVTHIKGTLHADVSAHVTEIVSRTVVVHEVVEGRVLTIAGDAASSVRKVAADLEGLRAACMVLRDDLAAVDVATDLFYEETLLGLIFDAWQKELVTQARIIAIQARAVALELKRRAQPDALALYRPRAGESLYDVANQFFGSPGAWRTIADRNGLYQFELTGTELLIIPARV